MSTKSREVIWGGRIMGARVRARGAREEAEKAVGSHGRLWRACPALSNDSAIGPADHAIYVGTSGRRSLNTKRDPPKASSSFPIDEFTLNALVFQALRLTQPLDATQLLNFLLQQFETRRSRCKLFLSRFAQGQLRADQYRCQRVDTTAVTHAWMRGMCRFRDRDRGE
jgi:hypothetical protein